LGLLIPNMTNILKILNLDTLKNFTIFTRKNGPLELCLDSYKNMPERGSLIKKTTNLFLNIGILTMESL